MRRNQTKIRSIAYISSCHKEKITITRSRSERHLDRMPPRPDPPPSRSDPLLSRPNPLPLRPDSSRLWPNSSHMRPNSSHLWPNSPEPIKRRPADGIICCPVCGKSYNVRGYPMHKKACHKALDEWEEPMLIADAEGENGMSHTSKSSVI